MRDTNRADDSATGIITPEIGDMQIPDQVFTFEDGSVTISFEVEEVTPGEFVYTLHSDVNGELVPVHGVYNDRDEAAGWAYDKIDLPELWTALARLRLALARQNYLRTVAAGEGDWLRGSNRLWMLANISTPAHGFISLTADPAMGLAWAVECSCEDGSGNGTIRTDGPKGAVSAFREHIEKEGN